VQASLPLESPANSCTGDHSSPIPACIRLTRVSTASFYFYHSAKNYPCPFLSYSHTPPKRPFIFLHRLKKWPQQLSNSASADGGLISAANSVYQRGACLIATVQGWMARIRTGRPVMPLSKDIPVHCPCPQSSPKPNCLSTVPP